MLSGSCSTALNTLSNTVFVCANAPSPPADAGRKVSSALSGCKEGVRRGSGGGQEGIYRSSPDARKRQNPINSEEYQGHLHGVLVRRG
eukprot:1051782-Prorocentrum_minimum.AAC.1